MMSKAIDKYYLVIQRIRRHELTAMIKRTTSPVHKKQDRRRKKSS